MDRGVKLVSNLEKGRYTTLFHTLSTYTGHEIVITGIFFSNLDVSMKYLTSELDTTWNILCITSRLLGC